MELKDNLHSIILSEEPVIITNALTGSNLCCWDFDYLSKMMAGTKVNVCQAKNSIYSVNQKSGKSHEEAIRIRFDEYVKIITGEKANDGRTYMQMGSFKGEFSHLFQDIEVQRLIPEKILSSAYLWVGPGGTVSPLHYDPENNFLIQVKGSKRLILFPHRYIPNLYPYDEYECSHPHLLQADITSPDYNLFPAMKNVEATEVVLKEGEMLFLPSGYCHQVHSESPSVSVNLWWSTLDWQFLKPHNTRLFYWGRKNLFNRITSTILEQYNSIPDLGYALIELGNINAACLFHFALIERLRIKINEFENVYKRLSSAVSNLGQTSDLDKFEICLNTNNLLVKHLNSISAEFNSSRSTSIWAT
ncbi:cupin-like domain-containing protein [Microbulbifer sp. JMSA004]|uniref:cupin-like domain-containing protein n=1 Tax=Microbulbifer sp. JMSA004 TaxID=3243370 RepID=UPI00403A61E5